MKKNIVRIFAVMLLLATWGSVPVLANSPAPVPLCWPNPCQ